ncbi:hypothetical protein L7F22_004469 [Adiantum nelumboides]|nr:hypothetical protein [Adiantum nelumboides]
MARLSGMSTESFSSARERLSTASVGLGSILRDQKGMPGTNRMNVLLGLSSQSGPSTRPATSRSLLNSPAHSLSSSPIESNSFLDVDDAELKDEELGGVDMNDMAGTHSVGPLHRHRLSHAYELGSSHAHGSTLSYHSLYGPSHSHSQKHGMLRAHLDASKQHINMERDGNAHSAHYKHVLDKSLGLTGAISPNANAGPVRFSPLSKLSESGSHYSNASHKGLTPSRTIPCVNTPTLCDSNLQVEHQSAPVNVPDWSSFCQKDNSAVNFTSIEEIGDDEDDDNERLIPPHVILAKEYARDQRMTSSVCEGQGRTLKGRDMRRVRNAVWQQTGFAD